MATRRDEVRRVKREDEYYNEDAYADDADAEDDGRGMGRVGAIHFLERQQLRRTRSTEGPLLHLWDLSEYPKTLLFMLRLHERGMVPIAVHPVQTEA
jgi:hypothetical protein